jgi:DNA-binding response OmpR family regulator
MKPDEKSKTEKKARKLADGPQTKQKVRTILIIDDEPGIRNVFTQKLAREGYEVLEAENGKEGFALCLEHLPDLVITDIVMPEKEGIETIMDLKWQFPEVKIIAISGRGLDGPDSYLDFAESTGALQTFTKPINWPKLLMAIKEILS